MKQKPKPVFLIAGSRGLRRKGPDPTLVATFTEFGIAKPSIAYVGVASGDDRSFFSMIASFFKEAGAGEVTQVMTVSEKADINKAKKILEAADIVFISGGDVEAGMEIVNRKGVADFLRKLYMEGKPFFGISAGSIMLAREWVRWSDPDDDSTAEIFPCLGIAPVICDTHAEGDNWEELKALLKLENDGTEGYGIPTSAAIRVTPEGEVTALELPVPKYARKGGAVRLAGALKPQA
ncbi:MAG TPA: Type 1 glutamine amidotransferase-like domain-containing protein [Dehalococcoidales bacterium]|nr:Type 1 glutamine amidotransferase-like domain-containing protein [Dehalococcoidales bacterium]